MQKEEELRRELSEIKQMLLKKELEEDAETEEEIVGQMQPNILGGLLNSPEIQQVLAAGVAGLVAKFLTPAGQPQAVAGIPEVTEETEINERINNALTILAEKDKDLCKHLEKLAEMATKENDKFNFLLKML
jgi:hypothetical protein